MKLRHQAGLVFCMAALLVASAFGRTSDLFAQTTITDSVMSEGIWRTYAIYLPVNYSASESLPLVISLHGYLSSGTGQESFVPELPRIADTGRFVIAYPDGLKDGHGYQYWNVGSAALPNEKNDVLFISAMIDQLHTKQHIDLQHVYANGIGDGGFMCHILAWQLSNRITAIASVSGGMVRTQFANCNPLHRIPVMEIHGTADISTPWGGSTTQIPIDTLISFWRNEDGCTLPASPIDVPDLRPSDGSSAKHWVYAAELTAITCELYQIVGGRHSTWPGSGADNAYFNASTAMWHFFKQYRLSDFEAVRANISDTKALAFYPNPCTNSIELNSNTPAVVTIADELGRTLITTSSRTIDVASLRAGIYILSFQTKSTRQIAKIVKVAN